MKIPFNQKFNQNSDFLIRRCGYGQIRDRNTGEVSYVHRLRRDFYPRFHLYINSEEPLVLNLHLDQKQASYEGYTAHSGDYDSDLVRQEANRIYNLILNEVNEVSKVNEVDDVRNKGFFARLFGRK
jgi:hypothetical protein